MSNKTTTIRFADFVTLQRGFDLPESEREPGQYPVVASTSIVGYHSSFKVRPPGVTTGRSGALGHVLYIHKPFWPLNTTLWVKNFHNNDAKYVYYYLHTLHLEQYNAGTGVPTLNRNHLDNLELRVHEEQAQHKIAFILSAYDDLIENNTRRIKILEEMAQSIYREWFVNFRFPGHEKVRMVDSKMGKIPEGWEASNLRESLDSIESGSRPKGGIDPDECEVPSIGAENIIGIGKYAFSKEKYVSRKFFLNMRRGIVRSKDVLLYKDGAQIGRKTLFRDGFPHQECCINEHVFILRSNSRITQNCLFFWLDQPDMTQNIRNLNANAAQPGINQEGVRGLPLLIPTEPLINLFDDRIEPLLTLLFNLAKKNVVLNKTRDIILPRLISGEIDVADLDIAIIDNGGN